MSNEHQWIKEKKSWMIHTTPSGNGHFAPIDPSCGRWTSAELERVFGTKALTTLHLQGKWTGEILIYSHEAGKEQFENGLAARLIRESTGQNIDVYGDVLMTLTELVGPNNR